MLSLGMVFLLATREIDLSAGWMFNFSAVVAALLMTGEVNPWLAAIAGVGFGALLGLVDGVLAIGLGLPAIIITLGPYSMFEGLSLVANHGRAVFPTDQSSSFFAFASMTMFRIVPVVVMLFVALPVVLRIVLTGHASVIVCRLLEATSKRPFRRHSHCCCALADARSHGWRLWAFRSDVCRFPQSDRSAGGGRLRADRHSLFGIDATWSTFVTGAVIVLAVSLDQIVKRQRDKALHP